MSQPDPTLRPAPMEGDAEDRAAQRFRHVGREVQRQAQHRRGHAVDCDEGRDRLRQPVVEQKQLHQQGRAPNKPDIEPSFRT